jgi:multiple sugar transport system ATP-binding protein
VTVQVVEPLGEKMDVLGGTAAHPRIVARVDAERDLRAGTAIQLHLDMRKVHIFEPGEVGKNLTVAAATN